MSTTKKRNRTTRKRRPSLAAGSGITLSLVLTHHWYDLTESGSKLTEYRAFTPRWKRLIWDRRNRITHVRFSRGYTRRSMTFRVDHIFIGGCPIEGWTGTFYCIRFHPNIQLGRAERRP